MKNKKDLFTIPNMICYLRILLIPVFCWMYITAETGRDYFWATMVVLISSFTDLFDGMIARKFNQVTDLGKILDPVADKLTHAALAVCLALRHPLMWALVALMAVKEGYMAVMGIRHLARGQMLNGAMFFGKVCTAMLFIGLLVLFLFPHLSNAAVNTIIVILMADMVYTLCRYISMYHKIEKGEHSEDMIQL